MKLQSMHSAMGKKMYPGRTQELDLLRRDTYSQFLKMAAYSRPYKSLYFYDTLGCNANIWMLHDETMLSELRTFNAWSLPVSYKKISE